MFPQTIRRVANLQKRTPDSLRSFNLQKKSTPTPTPTQTPTVTLTQTPTQTPSPTPTLTPTATETPFPSGSFYAWYDASDSTTLKLSSTSSTILTAWNDKSNNNNSLTSIVSSNPVYNTKTHNSLQVVEFPTKGSIGNTFMNVPGVSQTWFIVCQIDATFGNAASILSYMTRNPDNGTSSWEIFANDNDCFVGALGRSVPAPGALILNYEPPRISGGQCLNNSYHLFEVAFDRETLTTSVYLDGDLKDSKSDTLPWNQITGARFRIFVGRSS